MESTNTWDVTSLPKGKKAVGCRMLYSLKFNADGTIDRRKVHCVAKGYTQKEGLDYNKTFSHVAKMVTIKLLLKISASKRWILQQLDISNAFLNSDLEASGWLCRTTREQGGLTTKKKLFFADKNTIYRYNSGF